MVIIIMFLDRVVVMVFSQFGVLWWILGFLRGSFSSVFKSCASFTILFEVYNYFKYSNAIFEYYGREQDNSDPSPLTALLNFFTPRDHNVSSTVAASAHGLIVIIFLEGKDRPWQTCFSIRGVLNLYSISFVGFDQLLCATECVTLFPAHFDWLFQALFVVYSFLYIIIASIHH